MIEVVDNHRSRFDQVPDDWVQRRMKSAVARYQTEKNSDPNPTVLSLTKSGLKVKTDLAFGKSTENYIGHQMVRQGQFVFTPRDFDATPILCGVGEQEGCISNLYIVFDVAEHIDPRFLEYYFWGLKHGFDFFAKLSFGMRYSFNQTQFEHIPLIHPNLDTQKTIADFLDRETARIDQLIEKRDQFAALVMQRREARIARAVVGDAGSEGDGDWLARLPDDWLAERAKFHFRERQERSVTGEEELLTVSHITGVTPRSQKDVYMFLAESNEGYKIVRPGDIVINTMWAWMGAMGVSSNDGIISPSYGIYFPTSDKLLPEYVDLLLRSKPFVAEATRRSKGIHSSRLRLYPDAFLDTLLPIPPRDTQQDMLSELAARVSTEEKLLHKNEAARTLLLELRSALITSAVTGQIDVTTWSKQGSTDRRLDQIEVEMST